MKYYIVTNNTVVGPMDGEQMMSYGVGRNTSVSTDGQNWQPLFTYPELMQKLSQSKNTALSATDSKRIICGIFALLIGSLGIQYFLINKVTAGILTIIISIVTFGLWGVVMFIQGILMLTMSDEEFNRKYVNSPATYPIF